MTRRLLIVRHGDTFAPGEPPRRIGRRTDLPLVESGRAQAQALRHALAGIGFDRVLAGPLLRTRETARLVAGREPEIADWLAEIDHGPDEGLAEAAVTARVGEAALAAWDRDGIAPEGWIVDRDARLAAWGDVLADRTAGATLLVTSNGAARFALLAIGAAGPMKLRTGAWGEIVDGRRVAWDVRPEGTLPRQPQ